MKKVRSVSRKRRHFRVRKKIYGTGDRPRICVFRSLSHIYAQAVNDDEGITLAAASSKIKELPAIDGELKGKTKTAKAVGKLIAQRLQEKGVSQAVFDRGGYIYHGRVAALAEGIREGGIKL
ncbi:MAG: 50S ribosomal protein L18 [bacterium]|jgi:large subunit ribosomal protein L18